MTSSRLRIAFAGTPEIARSVLESVLERDEHDVRLVYTQPDRPAGRGRKLKPSEVKVCATERRLPVKQPATAAELKPDDLSNIDVMLVVAYGILLKPFILSAPKLGCINIHTSLLPRWRGAAPIQRSIEAGDTETGISIMQMESGLDTGPVIMQKTCPIHQDDTAGSLHDRLADLSKSHIHPLLNHLASGEIVATPQDERLACYANKITKAEAELDWKQPAIQLERKIRAFNPFPVAFASLNNIQMRIWQAAVKPGKPDFEPGSVVKQPGNVIDVTTGDGILSILQLQLPGKRVMSAQEFLNGRPDFTG